jgi:hypothetical protein
MSGAATDPPSPDGLTIKHARILESCCALRQRLPGPSIGIDEILQGLRRKAPAPTSRARRSSATCWPFMTCRVGRAGGETLFTGRSRPYSEGWLRQEAERIQLAGGAVECSGPVFALVTTAARGHVVTAFTDMFDQVWWTTQP